MIKLIIMGWIIFYFYGDIVKFFNEYQIKDKLVNLDTKISEIIDVLNKKHSLEPGEKEIRQSKFNKDGSLNWDYINQKKLYQ